METSKFLALLTEYMEVESCSLSVDTELKSLPEFSSLSIMSIIALVDEHFGKTISAKELGGLVSVKDLMALIGMENFTA
jgi:acyl carrier protein